MSTAWPPRSVDLACLHGGHAEWRHSTVIVPAVYREWHGHGPPAHLADQFQVYLYQRRNASLPCFCANRGYESGVYFRFMADHYNHLPALVAFVQGDWVFATKTSAGRPFHFWQPHCMLRQTSASAAASSTSLPWSDYMPLGGRRSVWPPRCVARPTTWYGRFVGRGRAPVVEACARELLHVVGWPGPLRPYDRARPLNITFYTNMNFLASRARLQRYPHRVYRLLARRFVDEGVCVPPLLSHAAPSAATSDSPSHATPFPGPRDDGGGGHAVLAQTNVTDAPEIAKFTLGMATELLQQSIFGDSPLENGPPPLVPQDGEHCAIPAQTSCALTS